MEERSRIKSILERMVVMSLLLGFLITTRAQTVIENSSFEDWENSGLIEEPVNWNSVQTGIPEFLASNAPKVLFKSTDAFGGAFSIRIRTTQAGIITTNGYATNGLMNLSTNSDSIFTQTDLSESGLNTPFTGRPDSLSGYFRFSTQSNGTARIRAAVHTGIARIPDTQVPIGSADTIFSINDTTNFWTRFSVPFNYSSTDIPEYLLLLINTGPESNPELGTTLDVDELELIYSISSLEAGISTSDFSIGALANQIVIRFGTKSFQGNFEYEIFTVTGQKLDVRVEEYKSETRLTDIPSGPVSYTHL